MITLPILLAQTLGQQPGENTGTTNSGEIVQGAIEGADLIYKSFENDWLELASGTNPIYTAVVAISTLAAVVMVAFASVGWYRKYTESGFGFDFVSEMVLPLLVIVMLSNNGFLLANTTLTLKNVSTGLNRSILSITRNGVNLKDAIRNVNADQSFIIAAQSALAKCETLGSEKQEGSESSPKQACIQDAIDNTRRDAQKAREKTGAGSGTGSWNPLDLSGELINSAIQGFVYVILSGLSAAG